MDDDLMNEEVTGEPTNENTETDEISADSSKAKTSDVAMEVTDTVNLKDDSSKNGDSKKLSSSDKESKKSSDHHSDSRKRRHDDSRSRKREDDKWAPPTEEAEEEFDDNLVVMDKYNSSLNIKLHQKRYTVQTLTPESFAYLWGSARATHGVSSGKICYECKVVEEHSVRHMPNSLQHRHVARIGWSYNKTPLLLGESEMSYAFCSSTSKTVSNKETKD